jgi:AraC-like DNA-binding protein
MRLHAPNVDFAKEEGSQARLVLLIPRLFFSGADDLDATYAVEDLGLGALLGDFLISLDRRLPVLAGDAAPSLADALAALLATGLAEIVPRQAAGGDQASPLLFDRICRHIQANLRAPDLGPAQLCHVLGVSRSRLYRLFERVGGVAAYIQLQRLQQARLQLAENAPRPVSQVAEEFGFKDASGFSRSFKKQFGFSPTEARRRAAPGLRRLQPPSRPCEPFDR